MTTSDPKISSLMQEQRQFPPPPDFQKHALINDVANYEKMWRRSKDEPQEFWGEQARALLSWDKPFTQIMTGKIPHVRWFDDGTINASYNCLDRHLGQHAERTAIIWEGEPGDVRKLTYRELHREVCRFANGLKTLGVKSGDRVTIYMPLVPEAAVAMLACARIGATHSVVFGGFSSDAVADRNNDASAKVVITADGGWRRGQIVPLKANVDEALQKSPTVQHVVVLQRTKQDIAMQAGRDVWWNDLVADQTADCPAVGLPSEHPLFVLYTSGSTGKPKGVLHSTGGYLLGAAISTKYVFDLKDSDIFWCTADVGWITGHSYVVYGPLAHAASIVMYEGAPMHPRPDRFWEIIERHKVSIFYTAPTAIRAFIKAGNEWPRAHNLQSLRLLGSVGEPINPEAWMWYRKEIGGDRCPIVDTWWQTETGSIMISALPGCIPTTPGCATKPFFGVVPDIVDKHGNSVPNNHGGFLVIRQPWPSMLRTIHGDDERFRKTYWEHIPGMYFTGDGARRDEHGNFWIMGRIDDVVNVSGHRLSTMEIESTLGSHPAVAESAVVSRPHDLKGECIIPFVVLKSGQHASNQLKVELMEHVTKHIGALARPEEIRFAESLPKTRSGKIMRRLLRDIARGQQTQGDVTTLEDLNVLAQLRQEDEE
jgi:acetyl-CoA synthetase